MVLFLFFFWHSIILQSIVCSMMHGRALKRIEKKKKICVQYRLIVFLSYFFIFFFSHLLCLSEWQVHTYKQFFIFLFFFSTWELDHDYDRNISCFILILSRGIHQPTLDPIFLRHCCHHHLMASYTKITTVTRYVLYTWSCKRTPSYCLSLFHLTN
jgi:hypothetical protein